MLLANNVSALFIKTDFTIFLNSRSQLLYSENFPVNTCFIKYYTGIKSLNFDLLNEFLSSKLISFRGNYFSFLTDRQNITYSYIFPICLHNIKEQHSESIEKNDKVDTLNNFLAGNPSQLYTSFNNLSFLNSNNIF